MPNLYLPKSQIHLTQVTACLRDAPSFTQLALSLSLSLSIYIYIYIYFFFFFLPSQRQFAPRTPTPTHAFSSAGSIRDRDSMPS